MDSNRSGETFEALVVGGGPAGMFCAVSLRAHFKRVALIEKNDRPGKKLLLSGSGQCNLTNSEPIDGFLKRYGKKGAFLKPALMGFDNEALLDFFRVRGLEFEERDGGKLFPASGGALAVLQILETELKRLGVPVFCNEKVAKIEKENGNFKVATKGKVYTAGILILATGGASYPSTGSSGDGYALAEGIGHRVIDAKPALSPIVLKDFKLKDLAGLAFEKAALTLWRNGRKEGSFQGPLLVTHDGFSGPVILNNSRDFEGGDQIEINYIHPWNRESFEKQWAQRSSEKAPPSIRHFLKTLGLTERFSENRMKEAGIAKTIRMSELGKDARKKLALKLTEDGFIIDRVKGFHMAMATAGGIDTAEINRKTMESKRVENLFFAGEIMDIDGETGGYNLQAAFSTARAIGKYFEEKR